MKKGSKHSLASCERMSAAHTGKTRRSHTDETKKKIGKANKKALLGNIPWNKGKKNVYSAETVERFRQAKLRNPTKYWLDKDRSDLWRGDTTSYGALHSWVYRKLGRPETCEFCGKKNLTSNKIHWANKSRQYRKDVSDWLRLCASCHLAYDRNKI